MRIVLTFIVLISFTVSTHAASTLWKLDAPQSEFFIAGSIHVLKKSDDSLPAEFEAAYQKADRIVFETDLEALDKPEIQAILLSRARYATGETLRENISEKTYLRLKKYLEERKWPIEELSQFKPWMLVMALSLLEHQSHGILPEDGIDRLFYLRAKKDGKKITWLESPEVHMKILSSLGDEPNDVVIDNYLDEVGQLSKMLNQVIEAWRVGDEEKLNDTISKNLKMKSPKVYQKTIVDRNQRWMGPIDALIRSGERVMMIVGSGHLVGEDGIIRQLMKKGHNFRKFEIEDVIAEPVKATQAPLPLKTIPKKKDVPPVDLSIAKVPLHEIYFDTFRGGRVPLSKAADSLILKLRDAIPPLSNPKYEGIAGGKWLAPDDLVIGYVDGDASYAYPIKILNFHEIVNDEIKGLPILVSYCPLCRSGIVYSRVLEGEVLRFGNTSALYESDMVMYDHQTGSYWHQVAGEAIVGTLSGKRLMILPSMMATWETWQALHPGTKILSRKTGYRRNYVRDSFATYPARLNKGQFAFPVSKRALDHRLHPADEVLAIEVNGQHRAYPLVRMGEGVVHDKIGDQSVVVFVAQEGAAGAVYVPVLNGREYHFRRDKDGKIRDRETNSLWSLAGKADEGPLKGSTLRPLPSRYAFWFAIVASTPEIQIYANDIR